MFHHGLSASGEEAMEYPSPSKPPPSLLSVEDIFPSRRSSRQLSSASCESADTEETQVSEGDNVSVDMAKCHVTSDRDSTSGSEREIASLSPSSEKSPDGSRSTLGSGGPTA